MKYEAKKVSARSDTIKQEFWNQFNIVAGQRKNEKGETETVGMIAGPDGTPKVQTVQLELLQVKDFETLAEAVADPEVGEPMVLRLFNTQYKTTAQNKCRQKYTGEVSETELEQAAMQLCFTDPQWQQAAAAASAKAPTDGGAAFREIMEQAKEAVRRMQAQAASAANAQATTGQQPPAQQPTG